MIRVKAPSGHILHVADDAAADYWSALGYHRVQDAPEAKPARKTRAKRAASKSDK